MTRKWGVQQRKRALKSEFVGLQILVELAELQDQEVRSTAMKMTIDIGVR